MNFDTLYKISKTGKILEWKIWVENNTIYILHGQQDGEKIESREIIINGKNIGKINETSINEQAILRAESRWTKQLDKSYRSTIDDAKKAAKSSIKPMLAHKFEEKKHKLTIGEELFIQPKLDGMRCIAQKTDKVLLYSRMGKPIECVPHINIALDKLMSVNDVWDGELYSHNLEFEDIMSICRKKRENTDLRYKLIQFWIFDTISKDLYEDRYAELLSIQDKNLIVIENEKIKVTDNFEEIIIEKTTAYEKIGYEGIILRKLNMPYENKRSVQLLKVKNFEDEEFEIVDSQDGKAGSRKANILQTFILKNTKGKEFKATLLGGEEKLRQMWSKRDSYVGKFATVVFQEKTKYGVPRFGKVKDIRY